MGRKWRRRRPKKLNPFRKFTDRELDSRKQEFLEELDALSKHREVMDNTLAEFEPEELSRAESLDRSIRQAVKSRDITSEFNKPSFLQRLIGSPYDDDGVHRDDHRRVREWEAELSQLGGDAIVLAAKMRVRCQFNDYLVDECRSALASLEKEASRRKREREAQEKEQRAAERARLEKARLAAMDGRTRALASTVKERLREQYVRNPICPYCGDAIGDVPHCDHIYPVVRGGHSTMENMVYICATCNQAKRDLTLVEFAEQQKLNYMQIVALLRELGKRP